MTKEEIKDELYRMLSDVVNGSCPIRNNTQRGRYRKAVKEAIEVLDIFEENDMTYGDIYDQFCKKFPNAEVSDYRPATSMFAPELREGIPYAIVVWLKDGSKMIYIAKEAKDE